MKAKITITVMLMAMTIGTLEASAQSARRGTSNEEQKRKVTSTQKQVRSSQTTARKTNSYNHSSTRATQRTSTPRTQSQYNKQANTAQRNTHARTTQNSQGSNETRRPMHIEQKPYLGRKTSTTTTHNPRSNYREPDRTVHVGKTHLDPRARTTQQQERKVVNHGSTGHHNKHYNAVHYPHRKVKIHVHNGMHNHYRVSYYPAYREIVWTRKMHRYYIDLYPHYRGWHYPVGYRIQTISAFDARYNVGEVSRVYGRVYATWFNRETDDLLLFFGGEYPYQEFTMVIPGHIARRYSWRPEKYFLGQHIFATGLITQFEGKPEMILKKKQQLDVY